MFSKIYTERVLEPCYLTWKKHLVGASYRIHRAHLVMLAERGIIDAPTARAIKAGIDSIEKDFDYPETIPENTEDLYFVFEKELGRRIGEDKAGFLHTARSRNDMDAAAFRIFMRGRLLQFLDAALALFKTLNKRLPDPEGGVPVILYTHGQPANVSTFAHYLSSMLFEAADSVDLICGALETVNRSPMGACAITTTGFPVDRGRVAKLLGFDDILVNSYGAISTSHWLTFPASAVRLFLLDLGRFIADLYHKASCEVGIIDFSDSLVQISSIMPQKRNPVILEHIRIHASLAAGMLGGMEGLFRNIPFQDVNEAGDTAMDEFSRALDLALSAAKLFEETINHISVNRERVYAISGAYGITTTELADSMVRDFGISFRQAHRITSAFVRSGLDKETLRREFRAEGFGGLSYTDEDIQRILSPENFISVRNAAGGPGTTGMSTVREEAGKVIEKLESFIRNFRTNFEEADQNLTNSYARL
jgi:argininosuccinate lyase